MKKILLAPLAAFCLNWSGAALSADFIAVRIEAEDYTSKSNRWVLSSPDSTSDVQPDPDPPHNSTASGNANLELLPDTRVTHQDEVIGGGLDGNFWGGPGGGPRIDYNVDIPEAGRYFVYVKTYSTGTEDNGIHVGVNGNLPQSGQRIQICSKHNWFWTSGQRTDENHCGVTKTIWLDFPAAGVNTVTFFAREDGFEIDQFLLLKETHDGSLDCYPTFGDTLRCKDIASGVTLSNVDIPFSQTVDSDTVIAPPAPPLSQVAEIDLEVDLNAIGSAYFVNDVVEYQVNVTNNSDTDTATNAVAIMDLPSGLVFDTSADCTESAAVVTCSFGDIPADSNATLSFTATVLTEDSHRIDAQVTADESDNFSANNTDSASITASISIPDYEAGISMLQSTNAAAIGGLNNYEVTVNNNGLQEISGAVLQITTDGGVSIQPSSICTPDCQVPAIAAGESTQISFNTVAAQSGVSTVTTTLNLADDADNANNIASLTHTIISPLIALSDNNSIVIEAEAFSATSISATQDAPRWLLVDNNFSELPMEIDPDNASPDTVSGNAYIEALPDLRTSDNALEIPGVSNFSVGGVGSTLNYNVFFSEAGNYNIYARVRPNNNQDARLHVGLNNEWPSTAAAIAVCNPDGTWQWTNNISNNSVCNTGSIASISVATPGMHTLMVSQDTDGLELDKLILSVTAMDNLAGNGPAGLSVNPATDADVGVTNSLSHSQVAPGDPATLTITVTNDSSNDASGVTISIEGLDTVPDAPLAFDSCALSNTEVVCSLTRLAANSAVSEVFTINTADPSTVVISTSISTALSDANTLNNSDQATLEVTSTTTESNTTESDGSSSIEKTSSGGGSYSVWFLLSLLLILGMQRKPIIIRALTSRVG